MSTPLQRKVQNLKENPSIMLARPKDSNSPFMHPERDLMLAWPLIHSEATSVVAAIYKLEYEEGRLSEEDANRKLMIVDTISKFFLRFLNEAVGSVAGAFGNLRELYAEMDNEEKKEILSQYNAAVTVAMPCMLFSCQSMSIGAQDNPQDKLDANSVINILHNLTDETRRSVVSELTRVGIISSKADVSIALRTMDPYLPGIRELQNIQAAAREAREK